ncbi:MAG: molybdopterin-dependent oxidoreductase, partial [Planctomycetales bacterium]|nr:molybdopterin-dependent oxidoreductase [Planctomycetales bacterium]
MRLLHSSGYELSRRGFVVASAGGLAVAAGGPTWAADAGRMTFHSREPNNIEPPLDELIADWITPNDLFYVRSHGPTPKIDPSQYRLVVEGLVDKRLSLTLDDLTKMADADVVASMTCAGNRRAEMARIREIKGVPWSEGAVGNARWSGLRLSTLLKAAGVADGARHMWFEGLDAVASGDSTIPFGGSIPVEKALQDTVDMPGAIIATKMNGQPLSPDHGFPARA